MPQNTTYSLVEDTYTLLTDADATAVTISNNSENEPVYLVPTIDTNPPASLDGSIVLKAGDRIVNTNLADLFPGVTGVDRLWAFAHGPAASVMISHAE